MKSLSKWLEDQKIIEVECVIPDITGGARGKVMSAEEFTGDNPKLAEGILLQTITGNYCDEHDTLVNPNDGDMHLVADPSTARVTPWASKPTAQVIHDCYTPDGELHPLYSRNVLRFVLEQYKAAGLEPVIAPEVEFYLIQPNTHPKDELEPAEGRSGVKETVRQSFGIDALYEYEHVMDTMNEYCKIQNLNIGSVIHEEGAAQMEVNFHHGDPLDLADQVFTFKRTMHQAVQEHDMRVTFMAKPIADEAGSSMHIHQSLLDAKTGKNVFSNEDGSKTDTFLHYMGGLQKYTPKLMSLYAPNINSYRRFSNYINAPTNLHWGIDNRTVGFRVPESPPEATRIENRFAGVDVNPYLAIAASLASGLAGIKNKLEPTEHFEGSAFEEESEVPESLESALEGLSELDDFGEIISNEFLTAYRYVKLNELAEFNQEITPWERQILTLNV